MATERTYTIPLRKEWLKSPKYRRAKKAISAVKQFLIKHMKSEDVRLGKYINEEIWKHGIKNPPGKRMSRKESTPATSVSRKDLLILPPIPGISI